MDWLLAPIDPARAHEVGFAVSWHARSMVAAWVILAPLAVLIARYYKIMPGQDWPRVLDSQIWWRSHWIGQSVVAALTVFGMGLIIGSADTLGWHGTLGYLLLILMAAQIAFGVFRGSKGGPTAPGADGSLRGDHYDMTPWRVAFEAFHKSVGYACLILALLVVVLGLWQANAPVWMWIAVGLWYTALTVMSFKLQMQGRAVDTYQAIWGPDPKHPGNQRKPIGWGVSRRGEGQPGE
jgi:cytochrome b561